MGKHNGYVIKVDVAKSTLYFLQDDRTCRTDLRLATVYSDMLSAYSEIHCGIPGCSNGVVQLYDEAKKEFDKQPQIDFGVR